MSYVIDEVLTGRPVFTDQTRFKVVAWVGVNCVHKSYDEGTRTFDSIWKRPPDDSAKEVVRYIVLDRGWDRDPRYAVFDRYDVSLGTHNRGVTPGGSYKLFRTEDAAIMAATILSSHNQVMISMLTHEGAIRWALARRKRRSVCKRVD